MWFSLAVVAQWYLPVVFVSPAVLPAPVFPSHMQAVTPWGVLRWQSRGALWSKCLYILVAWKRFTQNTCSKEAVSPIYSYIHAEKMSFSLSSFLSLKEKKKKRKAFCSFESLLMIHNFWLSPFIFLVWFCSCSCSVFILFLSFISFESFKALFFHVMCVFHTL